MITFKAIAAILLLCFQTHSLYSQSDKNSVVVSTKQDLKFKGKVAAEYENELVLILDLANDTIISEKSVIKTIGDVNEKDRMYFSKGRYHKKTGWVNSIGFHIGNLANLPTPASSGIGQNASLLSEYTGYLLIKPRLGLGAGIGAKGIPTRELGYEYFTYYKFYDIYAYAKLYLTNTRRRLFMDTKLGYGISRSGINYYCFNCDLGRPLNINYSSGHMIQPSIGVEFARARKFRSGIKLSAFFNRSSVQSEHWNYREDELVFSERKKYLSGLLIGLNFYY